MPICLTWPISHGQDCLHTAPPSPRRRAPHPQVLSFGTLNIRNGRGSGLAQAIWAVQIGGLDVMVLMDTKIGQRTPIIGSYILTSTLEHLPDLEEALKFFWHQDPIVIGDLSTDIGKPHNPHIQQVDYLMTELGLMDLLRHFQQLWRYRHVKTWPREI